MGELKALSLDKNNFIFSKIIGFIFLVLACFFYYFIFDEAPLYGGDSKQYIEVANDLKDFDYERLHYRTIGYPLLLVATDSYENPSKLLYLVSLIQYFFSVYLIALFLFKMDFNNISVLVFILILSLPTFVQNCAFVMTENFAEFNLVIGFILFVKGILEGKNYLLFLSGLFWGFSALVKPTYQFLIIPILFTICIYLFVFTKRGNRLQSFRGMLIPSISLVIGFFLFIGINIYVNKTKFNYFGLTPFLGTTLCTKTVTYIERIPDSYVKEKEILIKHRNRSLVNGQTHTGLLYIEDAIPELMDSTGMNFLQLSKHLEKINIELIMRSPLNYLQSVGNAAITFWFPYESYFTINNRFVKVANEIFQFALIIIFFLQIIYLIGFIINLIFLKKCLSEKVITDINSNKEYILLLIATTAIIFYTFFVTILVNVGNCRHRSPVDIFIMLFVFVMFSFLFKLKKSAAGE